MGGTPLVVKQEDFLDIYHLSFSKTTLSAEERDNLTLADPSPPHSHAQFRNIKF